MGMSESSANLAGEEALNHFLLVHTKNVFRRFLFLVRGGGGGGRAAAPRRAPPPPPHAPEKETCERRFLYAPAGNDLKPPPPPSSLTIRSFPSELIDIGSSLRARKQMHVS